MENEITSRIKLRGALCLMFGIFGWVFGFGLEKNWIMFPGILLFFGGFVAFIYGRSKE